MRNLLHALLLISTAVFSQKTIKVELTETVPFKAEQLVAINNFGTLCYTIGTTLYKIDPQNTYNYSNVQLGNITSADAFNPLKINIFYKNFNTVMILDNRLAEIYKINFNTLQPYKHVTHVSTGNDNTLWIYNQDLQHLELFDYKKKEIRATTMPIQSNVLDLKSNFNEVWLLTEKYLYQYNYFGSTLLKIKNEGYLKISEDNGHLIIQTKDQLYFLPKKSEDPIPIQLPLMLIKQFSLTNETLYIYTDETLHQFQLKIR